MWKWPLPIIAALILAPQAQARIKLITLPVRERVEVQLDHASVTLVEEERIVPLVKGLNQVDFSWANTSIDPNTIVFRVIGREGDKPLDVKVLSVSYPPNEAALVWQVGSSDSGSARVRISYVLGRLTKSFNYRAVAANNEKTLVLSQYIRLQNFANEEFGDSQVYAGYGTQFLKPIGPQRNAPGAHRQVPPGSHPQDLFLQRRRVQLHRSRAEQAARVHALRPGQ